MRKLYYSAQDLAAIINSLKLGAKEEANLLEQIWLYDRAYLASEYRDNKRKLILNVYYWGHYFQDKPAIDSEFPSICNDFASTGNRLKADDFMGDLSNLDLFFKSLRIKILFLGEQNYSRIKLRTLLKQYGYKRRSAKLMQYIRKCLFFYHIQPYTNGNECNIDDITIDEMITFRIL